MLGRAGHGRHWAILRIGEHVGGQSLQRTPSYAISKRVEEVEELDGILTPINEASIVVLECLVRITTLAESDRRDTLGMSLGIIGESDFACWSNGGREKLLLRIDASVPVAPRLSLR